MCWFLGAAAAAAAGGGPPQERVMDDDYHDYHYDALRQQSRCRGGGGDDRSSNHSSKRMRSCQVAVTLLLLVLCSVYRYYYAQHDMADEEQQEQYHHTATTTAMTAAATTTTTTTGAAAITAAVTPAANSPTTDKKGGSSIHVSSSSSTTTTTSTHHHHDSVVDLDDDGGGAAGPDDVVSPVSTTTNREKKNLKGSSSNSGGIAKSDNSDKNNNNKVKEKSKSPPTPAAGAAVEGGRGSSSSSSSSSDSNSNSNSNSDSDKNNNSIIISNEESMMDTKTTTTTTDTTGTVTTTTRTFQDVRNYEKRPAGFDYLTDDPFHFAQDDFVVTEGLHVSSPAPVSGACSCWNVSAACCERNIHMNHKMGHHVVFQLFHPVTGQYWRDGINCTSARINGKGQRGFRTPPDYFTRPDGVDYREVFVHRNMFETLVSGYLYHKAGYECWLNGYGQEKDPNGGKKVRDGDIAFSAGGAVPDPAGRTICRYLVEESEYDGMRVYAEWVMRWYYGPNLGIFKAVQENEDPYHRKTLFLCYEDLYYPEKKYETIQQIMDWFYPAGQESSLQVPSPPTEEFEEYNGNHASDHNEQVRDRLRNIAMELDENVFHGVFSKAQRLFGCDHQRRK